MKKINMFVVLVVLCTAAILGIAYTMRPIERPTEQRTETAVKATPTKSVTAKPMATEKSETVVVTGKISATFDTEQKFSAPK